MMPPQDDTRPAMARSRPLASLLWRGWRDYNVLAARYQRTALLSAIYLLILGPSGILARLAGQDLMRQGGRGSAWIQRPTEDPSLAALKRQY
jgi:hypothetical protein